MALSVLMAGLLIGVDGVVVEQLVCCLSAQKCEYMC